MQRNIYKKIQELLVVSFVSKQGQKCFVVSVVDISPSNVIHLPISSGSLRQTLALNVMKTLHSFQSILVSSTTAQYPF